ncbi:hypothetical protein AYO21_10937 [Fonsecaea monophora]|uniref:Heterokaryon incompatibility domain-containing protein n=1 Tax=Fonsecaea monophora TaxID=254056 RepID=A0A177ESC9_9EURO|nr:hypothetical protein AYO21_10937 [Fonsecaea monophora]OAG34887.1 hypothetical protein AYO21_10937 [Fonsecaea monophora]
MAFLGFLRDKKGITAARNVMYNSEHNARGAYIHAYIQTTLSEAVHIKLEIFKMPAARQRLSWLPCLSSPSEPGHDDDLPFFLKNSPRQTQISANTGSPEAFSRVFSWFKTCNADHPACGNGADAPLLPTRVIDITKADQLALVESNGARGHYLCLSHRWIDTDHMPRCTLRNISTLKENIPWIWITPTFQDAITFARQFSTWHRTEYADPMPIRYIWIDSLCIIQDSVEDWEKESKLMGSVYEGAILTVAAATGQNACFSVADPTHRGFCVSGIQHDKTRIYVREALTHPDLNCPSVRSLTSKAPTSSLDLLTRGWVLQERLLSRRFVLFTPLEIMWECLESLNCECGFHQIPSATDLDVTRTGPALNFSHGLQAWRESIAFDDPSHQNANMPFKIAYHRALSGGSAQRERNIRNWWRAMVEIHSNLGLTKDSDRIPALIGLGSQVSRICGKPEPRFGHFLDGLPLDLGWCVAPADKQRQIPLDSVPSWSWAHSINPVQMPREAADGIKVHPVLLLEPSQLLPTTLRLQCSVFKGFSDKFNTPNFPLTGRYFADNASSSAVTEQEPNYILLASMEEDHTWLFIHVKPVDPGKTQFHRLGHLEVMAREGSSSNRVQIPDAEALMRACFISIETMEIDLV